jgi:transcription elongation factor Elf1
MKRFTCLNNYCRHRTRPKDGIEHEKGRYFVTCYWCHKRHEIRQLPTSAGEPVRFEVVGMM